MDANALITPWLTTYHRNVFPSLWEALAQNHEELILIKPIFDEIEPMSSEDRKTLKNPSDGKLREKYSLRLWMESSGFTPIPISDDIDGKALELERKYQTDNYGKGANQNDIKLIAYAKYNENTVVTLESVQTARPKRVSNYKIPLICAEEDVECITFTEMLQKLKISI